jgi:hypothetical protein
VAARGRHNLDLTRPHLEDEIGDAHGGLQLAVELVVAVLGLLEPLAQLLVLRLCFLHCARWHRDLSGARAQHRQLLLCGR